MAELGPRLAELGPHVGSDMASFDESEGLVWGELGPHVGTMMASCGVSEGFVQGK